MFLSQRKSMASHLRNGALGLTIALTLGACNRGQGDVQVPAPPPPPPPAPTPAPEAPKAPERVYPDPPPPSTPRPVNFPEIQHFELPNKLQVYVVENHEVPLVDVDLFVKAGDVHHPLLASMAANMLREGTTKQGKKKGKTKAQIDSAIEQVGGVLSTSSGTHNSSIGSRVLTKDIDIALGLVTDLATAPAFPEESLKKIKDSKKTELKNAKSSPASLAGRLLSMKLYPEGHPYGRNFSTEAEIDAITIGDVKNFHRTWYRPDNSYLIVSGAITLAEAKEKVTQALGYWEPANSFPEHPLTKFTGADYQKLRNRNKPVVHIIDHPEVASSDIYFGNLALARNHRDWIKMQVLTKILGGGMSSRLFRDIREEKKLTYNINSGVWAKKAVGAFVIQTQTRKIDEMLNSVFGHIDRIRNEDVSPDELQATINNLSLSFPLGLETAQQIAGKVAHILDFNLPNDYYKTFRDQVTAVSAADIKNVAQVQVHPSPVIVIAGPVEDVKKQLANVPQLKEVTPYIYDLDLNPKQ